MQCNPMCIIMMKDRYREMAYSYSLNQRNSSPNNNRGIISINKVVFVCVEWNCFIAQRKTHGNVKMVLVLHWLYEFLNRMLILGYPKRFFSTIIMLKLIEKTKCTVRNARLVLLLYDCVNMCEPVWTDVSCELFWTVHLPITHITCQCLSISTLLLFSIFSWSATHFDSLN